MYPHSKLNGTLFSLYYNDVKYGFLSKIYIGNLQVLKQAWSLTALFSFSILLPTPHLHRLQIFSQEQQKMIEYQVSATLMSLLSLPGKTGKYMHFNHVCFVIG